MLFNSLEFLFIFFPTVLAGYFILGRYFPNTYAKLWLIGASLFFYGYWNITYLPVIIISVLANYLIATAQSQKKLSPKVGLPCAILFNLGLLGYYKYANFIVDTYTSLFSVSWQLETIELPLAISFFTFQQIAYQVDMKQGKITDNNFIDYCLFVLFFPQLIAGPIVHHAGILPQFKKSLSRVIKLENIAAGTTLFIIGLFKKVVLADTFKLWATGDYALHATRSFLDAWLAILAYTMQVYFDFSGYSDMAIGAALCFNIVIPINFFSPYKAASIQDFWRRWHITLSVWLRDYLFIPLGGSRCSPPRAYGNILITFLLGGLWHGAGWMFIFWGGLHGAALCINRFWARLNSARLPVWLGWIITFTFLCLSGVAFIASDMQGVFNIYSAALGSNGIGRWVHVRHELLICLATVVLVCTMPNSTQIVFAKKDDTPVFTYGRAIAGSVAVFFTCMLIIWMENRVSEFFYFQF
ncbi:MBOAT family O-acyltransferase [Halodesulfovibrio spirochaetisodalis]|uniref:Acetyltransferase n=1 Tax=Halodesulfovibrio spirochaetisodalis TaxID=1560234 RepID=A0A1B7XB99_9BACT|nr:MBOAT family O-acyltransferase [Halodesulfovibrio spirochaetisodalis]OBQ46644.1 hypothetical protein SP90_10960 [Halodesulfovibrio spirochaetisodalis]